MRQRVHSSSARLFILFLIVLTTYVGCTEKKDRDKARFFCTPLSEQLTKESSLRWNKRFLENLRSNDSLDTATLSMFLGGIDQSLREMHADYGDISSSKKTVRSIVVRALRRDIGQLSQASRGFGSENLVREALSVISHEEIMYVHKRYPDKSLDDGIKALQSSVGSSVSKGLEDPTDRYRIFWAGYWDTLSPKSPRLSNMELIAQTLVDTRKEYGIAWTEIGIGSESDLKKIIDRIALFEYYGGIVSGYIVQADGRKATPPLASSASVIEWAKQTVEKAVSDHKVTWEQLGFRSEEEFSLYVETQKTQLDKSNDHKHSR